MYKNKIPYRPRTADPSTLTTDNLLTLANIITTSGIPHHCPPSLGVLTSVQITMLYLQENIRQQTLASVFGTSQPTISGAINAVLNILDVVPPSPPQPKDLRPQRLYVLDGTLVPCWWWKNARNLYSGKHHRAGHNLQVLTDQAGQIFYISPPLPGSTHDITAIRSTGLFGHMQPWHITADIRLCGFRVRHTFQEKTRQTPARLAETIQQRDQPDPVCSRTIHSPPQNLADTIHP